MSNTRKGIIAVGNWVADTVKFIDVYPQKGNLSTITGVEVGLGGLAHNVIVDLASMKSGIAIISSLYTPFQIRCGIMERNIG